ncbi:hypothetical protein C8F01DRAFT_986513 [Mycena amicta]|nr:hypothetical protein C8F01DRAFT_986513 [Mycena amicta]
MEGLDAVAATISSIDVQLEESIAAKRKRYESDNPMAVWRASAPLFLNEFVRREGLGTELPSATCVFCSAALGEMGRRIFRCRQCGDHLHCEECVATQHIVRPLHAIQEWTGEFWASIALYNTRTNSRGVCGLGSVYQLGHYGFPCPFPGPRRSMVVVDVNGIFTLDIQYCDCHNTDGTDSVSQLLRHAWFPATTVIPATCATFNVLELFRLLRAVGNVTTHDFIRSLERLTDPTTTDDTPDRYTAFARMARQHEFLMRMKRAGRAHESDGMAKTEPGGLAVRCWACPEPGRNLPDGWRMVGPKKRFKYKLFVAMDSNFRMKNRIRANEIQDPTLGSGLGYFVEQEPYKTHIRNYVTEPDVSTSTCAAFAALLQRETRETTGLRVSGVAGCICARHGLLRRQGLGDLQKGERWANVDWVLLATLWASGLLALALAYDIICQYMIHFLERVEKISNGPADTKHIATDFDGVEIQYGLPVWHAEAHELMCRIKLVLSYLRGVGKTDGEASERFWAAMNPASYATKEMGEGSRHDTLEDKIDHLNYEKNIGFGRSLGRKLVVAMSERRKQGMEFAELDGSVSTGKRKEWAAMMDGWYEDSTRPNPFVVQAGPSEHQIMEELKKEEVEAARLGRAPLLEGKITVTAFIRAGLQIQEQQRRLHAALGNTALVTADRASKAQESRMALLKQMKAYEKLQLTYMPGVQALREADDARHDPDAPPPKVEDLKLYLPSDLTEEQRRTACIGRVVDTEARLRRGQCADALRDLRRRLHAQQHMVWFRDRNLVGQRSRTRSVTMMARMDEGKMRTVAKYRANQQAIVTLKGANYAPEFPKLEDSDINARSQLETDAEASGKLRNADGSRAARTEPNTNRGPKKISWIWSAGGDADQQELHDSIRVEWAKARARRERWDEEVELLREEMKRVLRYLRWEQEQWQARAHAASARDDVDAETAAGLRAYAMRQVWISRCLSEKFFGEWGKTVAATVKDAMAEDALIYQGALDGAAHVLGGMAELEEEDLRVE